ncbi:MAG: peptide chain release factor 1 [Leptolyngbya sp. SIO1D8]|nr:peptide chain release factor 1 [Leptolyngbya sp. SIO1D8]
MRNPLWRLKTLPWVSLLQNALLTVAIATLLDVALLLFLGLLINFGFQEIGLVILGGGFGFMLLLLAAAGSVGALSIILMERFFRNVILDAAALWALVVCLAGILYLKGLTQIPELLVGLSQLQFIGMLVGLSAQGRRYWRW